jgi:hypothetical protein
MFLDPFDVFEAQLCPDNIHITDRIYFSFYMNYFWVVKGTNNLKDAIDRADV